MTTSKKRKPKRLLYTNKDGLLLYVTPVFTYELSIVKLSKNLMETVYHCYKYSTTPVNIVKESKTEGNLITTIDWIGAPKTFLINNNFKQL